MGGKTEFNVNYIRKHGLYRAVNSLRLGYKKQLVNVAEGNNFCLF